MILTHLLLFEFFGDGDPVDEDPDLVVRVPRWAAPTCHILAWAPPVFR